MGAPRRPPRHAGSGRGSGADAAPPGSTDELRDASSEAQASAGISSRQVEAFLAVKQCASLTGAAEALGLSASGLRKLIAQLESQLGVELFERSARSVGLSAAGEAFLPYAHRLSQSFQGAIEGGETAATKAPTQIRLAVGSHVLNSIASGLMRRAVAAEPPLALRLLQGTDSGIPVDMRSARADLGLCMLAGSELPGLDCKPLLRAPMGLMAAPGLRLPRRITTLRDLDGLPFARLEDALLIPRALRSAGLSLPAYFDARVVCNSAPALVACVSEGGLATIVSAVAAASPPMRHLKFIPLPELLPFLQLGLLAAPGGLQRLEPQVQMVCECVSADVEWPPLVQRLD